VSYKLINFKNFGGKILKNREFESLRQRVWREIAAKKPRVRENREFGTASLRGISVSLNLLFEFIYYLGVISQICISDMP
jgi:hypothetical protein